MENREVQTYGRLTVLNGVDDNFVYHMLAPRPVEKFDDWIKDDERCFYVADFITGAAKFIVVRGNYIIDYGTIKTIEVSGEEWPETNEIAVTPV